MSTATDTPVKNKKKKVKGTTKTTSATPDAKTTVYDPLDALLASSLSKKASGEAMGKSSSKKSPKKRLREEAPGDTDRDGSPSKKLKENTASQTKAREISSGSTRIIEPPNGTLSQESPSKSKRKASRKGATEAAAAQSLRELSPQVVVVASHIKATPKSAKVTGGTDTRLLDDLESPFVSTTASFKVTVPPVAQLYPLEGALAHYITPLLLTWHPQLDGILLAYNNAKLHTNPPIAASLTTKNKTPSEEDGDREEPMAQAVDECAAPYIWLTLDALVFKPTKGLELEGYLNLQNESHITLILWNFFTVTINNKRLPKHWVWHEHYEEGGDAEENVGWDNAAATEGGQEQDTGADKPKRREDDQWGAWYDGEGTAMDGLLRFRIRDWDCAPPGANGEGSFLSIEGSMLSAAEEEALDAEIEEDKRNKGHRRHGNESGPKRARAPLQSALKGGGRGSAGAIANGSSPAVATPKMGKTKTKTKKGH